MMNLKEIHIGRLIREMVDNSDIELSRICKFFNLSAREIDHMYTSENMATDLLLKWSKLLKYDFFRIYTQHLTLYSPPVKRNSKNHCGEKSQLSFRKNIYTKEIIDFMLEMIEKGEKTKAQIITEYNIPKTTLYKWIEKNKR